MQIAVIEFARSVIEIEGANSTEFADEVSDPVIDIMEDQKSLVEKGATMRLGAYDCELVNCSRTQKAYGEERVRERHRHRYEFNNRYRERFEEAGFRVAGINPRSDLVEIMELVDHPWYIGVQFTLSFNPNLGRLIPFSQVFVAAALDRRKQRGGGGLE